MQTMKAPWFVDVMNRRRQPEIMDQPEVEVNALRRALKAIATINSLAFTHHVFWKAIRPLAESRTQRPLRILDIACGSGDVPVRLAKLAQRAGVSIDVDGCDRNPIAVSLANERANAAKISCHFFAFDVHSNDWPDDYDVITTSLFLHHLNNEDAISVLRKMSSSARRMVLVNDLIRSRTGYFLARFGARLLTQSSMVHYDAPTSVAGAFTPLELMNLAHNAGMFGATISRCWMSRMQLEWYKKWTDSTKREQPR